MSRATNMAALSGSGRMMASTEAFLIFQPAYSLVVVKASAPVRFNFHQPNLPSRRWDDKGFSSWTPRFRHPKLPKQMKCMKMEFSGACGKFLSFQLACLFGAVLLTGAHAVDADDPAPANEPAAGKKAEPPIPKEESSVT